MSYDTTLHGAVSATQTELYVDGLPSAPYPSHITIGSEVMALDSVHGNFFTPPNPTPKIRLGVTRGALGTTKATHADEAAISAYSSGGGSGGVTVDNTVDPPFSASTIIVPGATESAPDEATLPVVVLQRTVTLTDAQIKALPGTSITVVPAPGANKIIALVGAFIRCDSTGGFYDWMPAVEEGDPVAQLSLRMGSSDASVVLNDAGVLSNLLSPEEDVSVFVPPVLALRGVDPTQQITTAVPQSTLDMVNVALKLNANNGGADTNAPFTGGDAANFMSVTVWYAVVDVA